MIDIKYKDRYDKYISHYKNVHVNPWHEISEDELNEIYDNLINSMDINDEYSFNYFMNYIIKRLSGAEDAHTKYDSVSRIPMNFKMFDNEVIINYPNNLRGCKLVFINGISMDNIINELEQVITYGTDGKRKYEIEKLDKEKVIEKINKEHKYSKEELFDYEKYNFDIPAAYSFVDNCLIYKHSSVQKKYEENILSSINNLKQEDISNIDTFIIDIRGNIGGYSELNKPLINFIKENSNKKIICLTDYRVFSAGRFALKDLIDLGATTIGEEIGTPINCYGNNSWIEVDNQYFASSSKYFNPIIGWSASSQEEFKNEVTDEILKPIIFKPDIYVLQTKEDYINGVDTVLEYALEFSKENKKKF